MKQKTENPAKTTRLSTLKILIFLFFGATQCAYAYLPYHMEWLGFSLNDVGTITAIASLTSVILPIILGIILDAMNRPGNYGKWLRVLLFIFYILAAISFLLLYLIPQNPKPATNEVIAEKSSNLTFSCNNENGSIYVRRNNEECENRDGHKGSLKLFKCKYVCELPDSPALPLDLPTSGKLNQPYVAAFSTERPSGEEDYDGTYIDEVLPQPESLTQSDHSTIVDDIKSFPHICVKSATSTNCYVYLKGVTNFILINDVETPENSSAVNNKFSTNWCKHSLVNVTCNVPDEVYTKLNESRRTENIPNCIPGIQCLGDENIEEKNLVKIVSNLGAPDTSYYVLRIIAELFPILIHMILNIMIIISTRETSIGRGNVGHQLVFYPIGVLVFASVLGEVNHFHDLPQFEIPFITYCVTMILSAIVVLFSGDLPLTPSDWWWHTKCGMLAIPMSALKRFKWVIIAIATVAFILGGLWHVQEAYRHINLVDIIECAIIDKNIWRSNTFVYIIGALLAIPLIWNGEKIVDCLGHSNIFILASVSFALRFSGIYLWISDSWNTMLEIMEPLSFYLTWLALFLFIRHLIPKNTLALGQALLIVLYFALGRAVGFFFGISDFNYGNKQCEVNSNNQHAESSQTKLLDSNYEIVYSVAAAIACFTAIIYFIIYHLILLPRYRIPINRLASNAGNNMSPQHVFHDERSRKGYFRY